MILPKASSEASVRSAGGRLGDSFEDLRFDTREDFVPGGLPDEGPPIAPARVVV